MIIKCFLHVSARRAEGAAAGAARRPDQVLEVQPGRRRRARPSGRRTRRRTRPRWRRCSTQHAPWYVIPCRPQVVPQLGRRPAAGRAPARSRPALAAGRLRRRGREDRGSTRPRSRPGAATRGDSDGGEVTDRSRLLVVLDLRQVEVDELHRGDHVAGQRRSAISGSAAHRLGDRDRARLERQSALSRVYSRPGARYQLPTAMWRRPWARSVRTASAVLGPDPVANAVTQGSRWWVAHCRARRATRALLRTSVAAGGGEDEAVELGDPAGPQRVAEPAVDDGQQLGLGADRSRDDRRAARDGLLCT